MTLSPLHKALFLNEVSEHMKSEQPGLSDIKIGEFLIKTDGLDPHFWGKGMFLSGETILKIKRFVTTRVALGWLVPYAGAMRRYPVSVRINQVENDDAECARPVEVEA